jgi:hypothetical protein
MIPVKQTIHDGVNGNCFAACIASICEVPLDTIPHCIAADDWWEQYQAWAEERGMELTNWHRDDAPIIEYIECLDGVYYMAAVPSLNIEDSTHSVVMFGKSMVHDPSAKAKHNSISPSDIKAITIFLVRDPSKFYRLEQDRHTRRKLSATM